MSSSVRQVLLALAIVVISALSHAGLFRAGWLGDDLPHLGAAARAAQADPRASALSLRLGWLEEGRVRPIPGLLLTLHARTFGSEGAFAPSFTRSARVLSWLVLLGAAAAFGFALRRALLPWVGGDQARAAGFALALLAAAHPLGTSAIARPDALGDLAALGLCGASGALFLRGRQTSRKSSVAVAALLAIVAGFASSLAILAAPVFAGLELGSARRARPLVVRARTAATTFVVFAACALFESLIALAVDAPARAHCALSLPAFPAAREIASALPLAVEKLGILFLPVPGRGLGAAEQWPFYLVLTALALVALQPVLRSARAAPRLWGWFAVAWIAALAVALVPHAALRVAPGDDSAAQLLFPASLFACAGLAVAATAQSGTRRVVVPLAIALGFAWVGHVAARGFESGSSEIAALRGDLSLARALVGPDVHVLLVDPIERAEGLDLGLDALPWLVSPALEPAALRAGTPPRTPRIVSRDALDALVLQPEFAAWRRAGLALVVAPETLGARHESADDRRERRAVMRVPDSAGSAIPPITWREHGRSGLFEVDPARVHGARIRALPDTSTAEAPRIFWRATEPSGEEFSATGAWLTSPGGALAVFDLARSPDWWSARTVLRAWTDGALRSIAFAELLEELPLAILGGEPRVSGNDWRFEIDGASEPVPVRGETRYVLELLDLASLHYARIQVSRARAASGDVETAGTTLTAPGAAGFEAARRALLGGPIAWSLAARVGDVTVARASGRR